MITPSDDWTNEGYTYKTGFEIAPSGQLIYHIYIPSSLRVVVHNYHSREVLADTADKTPGLKEICTRHAQTEITVPADNRIFSKGLNPPLSVEQIKLKKEQPTTVTQQQLPPEKNKEIKQWLQTHPNEVIKSKACICKILYTRYRPERKPRHEKALEKLQIPQCPKHGAFLTFIDLVPTRKITNYKIKRDETKVEKNVRPTQPRSKIARPTQLNNKIVTAKSTPSKPKRTKIRPVSQQNLQLMLNSNRAK